MKFQNPILKFVGTDGRMDGRSQSNMPLQLCQAGGGGINFTYKRAERQPFPNRWSQGCNEQTRKHDKTTKHET